MFEIQHFYITARCLLTQEYFSINQGFENSYCLYSKKVKNCRKLSKKTKAPASEIFQNREF